MLASRCTLPVIVGLFLIASPVATRADGQNFEWKQCDEDVLALRIDPDPVRKAVEPDFSIMLDAGMAMALIIVQECSQYWIDGENLGRNSQVHILVRLEGPQDIRPVVGAQRTVETFTWYSVFVGSTNPGDATARMESGTSPELIEAAFLNALGSSRGGKVSINPSVGFSWSARHVVDTKALLGVNHDIYVRDDEGNIVLKRIQAIANLAAGPTPGQLTVTGGLGPNKIISAGNYPVLVYSYFPIWARGTLGDKQPQ